MQSYVVCFKKWILKKVKMAVCAFLHFVAQSESWYFTRNMKVMLNAVGKSYLRSMCDKTRRDGAKYKWVFWISKWVTTGKYIQWIWPSRDNEWGMNQKEKYKGEFSGLREREDLQSSTWMKLVIILKNRVVK